MWILVAEDDIDARRSFVRLLQYVLPHTIEIVEAPDGHKAKEEIAARGTPSVIVSDNDMGAGPTGLDLLNEFGTIPFILFSGDLDAQRQMGGRGRFYLKGGINPLNVAKEVLAFVRN